MDKRSPKSPVVFERYKSGCAWSLIRFCDFGQGPSSRKLIADRRGLNSRVVDDLDTRNRPDLFSNSDGKCQCIDDGVNNKSLMFDSAKAETGEGEMTSEQQIKKKISNNRLENVLSDSQQTDHLPKNCRKKASKTFKIHGCKDIATMGHGQTSYENSVDKYSKKFNTAAWMEASCDQGQPKSRRDFSSRSDNHQKHNQHGEINLQVKMNEAAEAFINQKFIKGRDLEKYSSSHQSKHFLDALEILNSNKDLFIKLLQDPNSLLVKHIQDLHHSQAKEQETKSSSEVKLSEICRTTVRESKELCDQNSHDRYPSEGNVDPQNSERIVVLKPGSTTMQTSASGKGDCSSPQSLYSLRNRVQSTKPAYFSFEHMKRKLRHAIGLSWKEKSSTSTDCIQHKSSFDIKGLGAGGTGIAKEIAESSSLGKFNFGTGEMARSSPVKKRDKLGKVKESESGAKEQVALNGGTNHGNSKLSVVRHLKQRESNIYLQSRKHLSELLRDRNEDFSRKQVSGNSGRIVSLPEYDFLSALSLGRHREHGFMAAQMRFCPYSYYQLVNEKKQQLQKEKKNGNLSPVRQITDASSLADNKRPTDRLHIFDKRPIASENHFPDIRSHGSVSSLSDTSSSRGSGKNVEMHNTVNPGEISDLQVPLEPIVVHNNGANQTAGPVNTCEDNGYFECSKLNSPMENCASPSLEDLYYSPRSIKRLEDSDSMQDIAEHPSPVSVLEQFFVEDITCPPSAVSPSAEPAVEPKHDNLEEQCSTALVTSPQDMKINPSSVTDEHESTHEYIMTVLQASGIKWEEISMKCHLSDQLLEPSLLDEVEAFPNKFCGDHKLLFDHINEVLLEIYQCHFSCSPWVSFLKPKIHPVQASRSMVNEVMKYVDWELLSHQSFRTLEQLVEKDLAKSRTWIDIQNDTEDAVSELVDGVLEELTLEILLGQHI